jgi:hypothetical protein
MVCIKKLFWKSQYTNDECPPHDFEIISISDNYFKHYYTDVWKYYYNIEKEDDYTRHKVAVHFRKAKQMVCVKCGKCIDEVKIAKQRIKEQGEEKKKAAEARKRRRLLAKKMWEDGCKNGD